MKNIQEIIYQAYKVREAWDTFGGSFLKGLSQALIHADIFNIQKIYSTWTEEWEKGLEQYEKYIQKKGN